MCVRVDRVSVRVSVCSCGHSMRSFECVYVWTEFIDFCECVYEWTNLSIADKKG